MLTLQTDSLTALGANMTSKRIRSRLFTPKRLRNGYGLTSSLLISAALVFFSSLLQAQSQVSCDALNSHILKQPIRYCVVLPADYASSQQRYPVLYFLHGLGQNEQTLFNTGGLSLIDDL